MRPRRVNADIYLSPRIFVNVLAVLLVPLTLGVATLLHERRQALSVCIGQHDSC
jgi:hypothetical protein